MKLETVPDFDRSLQRFEAWWDCHILDRPPVTIGVRPERKPRPLPRKTYPTLRDRWLDWDRRLDEMAAFVEVGVFVGDAFPWFRPNLGPVLSATTFGASLEFGENTSWVQPCVASVRDIPAIQPSLDAPPWRAMIEGLEQSLERGRGRWITAMSPIIMQADLVAALRGTEALCLDLATDQAAVRAACDHVARFFPLLYEDQYRRVEAAGQLTTTWIPWLHAGRAHFTQCDFCCMISTPMFREAVLPSIVAEMRYVDRNIFHLDGPGAIHQLDTLLALEELDAVQWVSGAGNGPGRRWIDIFRRIQHAGKAIQLLADDLQDAKAIAEHLRPEGVWLCPGGGYSRAEAEDFIRWTERWAAGKKST